uniref:Phospholipid/glycerol acyltransferase domain-containing protein n=2 Tax=Wuchereria bancrofti TaxID=6293 RepID=A0AAF5RXS1_WUCBA
MYFLIPLLPLMFFNHILWRRIVDRLIGFWIFMPCGLIEVFFGARVTVSGMKIDHSEPALIIMNHRTCLDWLFFWNALIRIDPWLLTSQKISLKAIVRHLPGAGWAMASNAYLFLTRRFEKDQAHIEEMIEYYANSKHAYQLLLFPEGTDKDFGATERSRRFALKQGLIHYNYVLHPRTTGFTALLRKMRQVGYIKTIYDVTVAYADTIVQSEFELFSNGSCPKNIHFYVSKIDINNLPEKNDELTAQWLTNCWKAKEEKLAQFYHSDDAQYRTFKIDSNYDKIFSLTAKSIMVYAAVVIFWVFTSIFLIYAFFCYPSQYLLVILTVAIFFGSQFLFGGFEHVAIQAAKYTSDYAHRYEKTKHKHIALSSGFSLSSSSLSSSSLSSSSSSSSSSTSTLLLSEELLKK